MQDGVMWRVAARAHSPTAGMSPVGFRGGGSGGAIKLRLRKYDQVRLARVEDIIDKLIVEKIVRCASI